MTEKEFKKVFPDKAEDGDGAGLCGWKPIHSDALGVHPLDIPEAIEDAIKKGVPTEFDTEGRPILSSRSHRKRYLKAYGFHDRRGGYGD